MKLLQLFGISAIFCTSLVFSHNLHKIKIVGAQLLAISPEYYNVNTHKLEVRTVNATYNSLDFDFTIIKDLPLDTEMVIVLFRSDLNFHNYELIREYSIPICADINPDVKHYIPDEIIMLQEAGLCVPKGHYVLNDAKYFKFYNLLFEHELANSEFTMFSSLKSGSDYLFSLELKFVSTNC